MDIFNTNKIKTLESQLALAINDSERFKRDINTLEKDNERLRKKCGESKPGPTIVRSGSSRFIDSAKEKRNSINNGKNSSNAPMYVDNAENGFDVLDSISEVADDVGSAVCSVGEGVGELIGAALD